MTIALIADIHGNPIALDAVLADARACGAEEFWFLGDICAIGPEPAAVLDLVDALPRARFIRGNTDRYVVTGEGPPPHLPEVRANPDLIPTFAGIAASVAWTAGYLSASGRLDWLTRLPLEFRHTTEGGVRILAVHAAPGTDDGEGIHRGRSNAELGELLDGSGADLVLVGHTHEPMVRQVGHRWVVNPGSVGNPMGSDTRASYALLRSVPGGIGVRHRRIAYDVERFVDIVGRSRHPSADFILSYVQGGRTGRVRHPDQGAWLPDEEVLMGRSLAVEAPMDGGIEG